MPFNTYTGGSWSFNIEFMFIKLIVFLKPKNNLVDIRESHHVTRWQGLYKQQTSWSFLHEIEKQIMGPMDGNVLRQSLSVATNRHSLTPTKQLKPIRTSSHAQLWLYAII